MSAVFPRSAVGATKTGMTPAAAPSAIASAIFRVESISPCGRLGLGLGLGLGIGIETEPEFGFGLGLGLGFSLGFGSGFGFEAEQLHWCHEHEAVRRRLGQVRGVWQRARGGGDGASLTRPVDPA